MKLHLLRRLLTQLAATLAAGLILASCGGGGAATTPEGGTVQIFPNTGTVYAGVPATFTLSGGKRPYSLSSDQPGILPVPATLNDFSFTVLPANPGVIDTGLPPGALPIRTTHITVRDATGGTAVATIAVGQNFLFGYGISLQGNCPTVGTGATATASSACSGGETLVTITTVFNGSIRGNQLLRFDVVKGPFQFEASDGSLVNSITAQSDHLGNVRVIFRVQAGVGSQVAVLRVTDVATGVTMDEAFVISQQASGGTITAIPSTVTFTGNLTTDCGVGSSDISVFDGVAPYAAVSSNPRISVTPAQSNSNPGRFTITVGGTAPPCATGTVAFSDATGARATVTVTSSPGAGVVAPPATFNVQPQTVTLQCSATPGAQGTSQTITAIGGSGSYSASSNNPGFLTSVSGSTITITRAASGPFPDTGSVVVTDGASFISVAVSMFPAGTTTCP